MICPFRFKEFAEPSHQECRPDCAWLVKVREDTDKPMLVCAVTLVGSPMECPRRPMNTMEEK